MGELIDLVEADIIVSVPSDSKTTDVKMAELTYLRRLVKEVIEERKIKKKEKKV